MDRESDIQLEFEEIVSEGSAGLSVLSLNQMLLVAYCVIVTFLLVFSVVSPFSLKSTTFGIPTLMLVLTLGAVWMVLLIVLAYRFIFCKWSELIDNRGSYVDLDPKGDSLLQEEK